MPAFPIEGASFSVRFPHQTDLSRECVKDSTHLYRHSEKESNFADLPATCRRASIG